MLGNSCMDDEGRKLAYQMTYLVVPQILYHSGIQIERRQRGFVIRIAGRKNREFGIKNVPAAVEYVLEMAALPERQLALWDVAS